MTASSPPPPPTRLSQLRAVARRPGEAAFFFRDATFQRDAVKVLPGEHFVDDDDILITTTLGSCIAACLWDREARVGGMNHFMLPHGDADSGRYGSYAMELLINELMRRGAARPTLEAKIFGGAHVIAVADSMQIGERNTRFVIDYLKTERIPVIAKDVLGPHPRRLCFLPASGKALVKRLTATSTPTLAAEERSALLAVPAATGGGSVDLF